MKLKDIILTILAGECFAVIATQLLDGQNISFFILTWVFYFLMPILAIVILWLADLISQKYLFICQFAKYCLIGTLSTFADMEIFLFLAWLVGFESALFYGAFKVISFLIATYIKFIGNKFWTFEDYERKKTKKEFFSFLLVTFSGLLLDVAGFILFARAVGPRLGVSIKVWKKISVVLSALLAAVWNFLGYKFFVFKHTPATIQQLPPTA